MSLFDFILQYADDTTLMLKSENELIAALDIIEEFGSFTGLKLNRNKSVALPVGGHTPSEDNTMGMTWVEEGGTTGMLRKSTLIHNGSRTDGNQNTN